MSVGIWSGRMSREWQTFTELGKQGAASLFPLTRS